MKITELIFLKNISKIILLSSILSLFSCTNPDEIQNSVHTKKSLDVNEIKQTEKCLLIHFYKTDLLNKLTFSSVIPKKWNTEVLEDGSTNLVDDFSDFFPLKKIFYTESNFKPKGSTRILIWEYGSSLVEVDSLPKELDLLSCFPKYFAQITINSLQNDSILCFTSNKKNYKLGPNNTFIDTIVSIKINNLTIEKSTRIIIIENYGLIVKKNIYNNANWKVNKKKYNLDSINTPYTFPEEMPVFYGGDSALHKYLTKNIKYPHNLNIKGRVYVEIIIDSKGKVTSSKIIHGINPTIDKEVLRVVRKMPSWIPAKNNGNKVFSKIVIPIDFKIQ